MAFLIIAIVLAAISLAEMVLVGSSYTLYTIITIFCFLIGVITSLYVLAFFSKFMKKKLLHDPNNDSRIAMFIAVDENRQVIIEREGNPIRIISGGKNPDKAEVIVENQARSPIAGDLLYNLFKGYEQYIFKALGLYVYVPYFTKPKVIPLTRYVVTPEEGENVYRLKSDYTNHVRNAMTTWYFEYKGLDIEGIPFTISGSLQYRIDPTKVREALYYTDAWNVLLDQTAISVIRSTVRHKSTIDKVIGKTSSKIWGDGRRGQDLYNVLSKLVLNNLISHTFGENRNLADVGIIVTDVMFNDFEPELTEDEKLQLRAPALQLRVARGQTAIGDAVAANHGKLIAVHKDGGETSERILTADAMVRASQGSGGLVEALLATFVNNNMRK